MDPILFRQLILAILAMDSYNRGYGRGLKFSPDELSGDRNEIGSYLGSAEIVAHNISDPAQATSFYGIAYDMSGVEGFAEGETVIAYRGTDNLAFWDSMRATVFGGETDGELNTGYGIALGHPDGPQATLAIQFYKAVAESIGATAYNTANITLNGHSMGVTANDNTAPASEHAA